MRYSHEYKLECIELYRQGIWPKTPEGIKEHNFHITIVRWARTEDAQGSGALKHKNFDKKWTADI